MFLGAISAFLGTVRAQNLLDEEVMRGSDDPTTCGPEIWAPLFQVSHYSFVFHEQGLVVSSQTKS
jgi:hypothetical protein